MSDYECEVETPDGTTFVFRGPSPRTVSAQAARLPAMHEQNRREREVDLPPQRWRKLRYDRQTEDTDA